MGGTLENKLQIQIHLNLQQKRLHASILYFLGPQKLPVFTYYKDLQQWRQHRWMYSFNIKSDLPITLCYTHKSPRWTEKLKDVSSPLSWYKLRLATVNFQGDKCSAQHLWILKHLYFIKNKLEGTIFGNIKHLISMC